MHGHVAARVCACARKTPTQLNGEYDTNISLLAFEIKWHWLQIDKPTDPFMSCDWGDGSGLSPNEEPFNMTYTTNDTYYRIPYDYGKHNEYTYSCTMSNHVSNMTIGQDVSLLSKVYQKL